MTMKEFLGNSFIALSEGHDAGGVKKLNRKRPVKKLSSGIFCRRPVFLEALDPN